MSMITIDCNTLAKSMKENGYDDNWTAVLRKDPEQSIKGSNSYWNLIMDYLDGMSIPFPFPNLEDYNNREIFWSGSVAANSTGWEFLAFLSESSEETAVPGICFRTICERARRLGMDAKWDDTFYPHRVELFQNVGGQMLPTFNCSLNGAIEQLDDIEKRRTIA